MSKDCLLEKPKHVPFGIDFPSPSAAQVVGQKSKQTVSA